MREQVFELRGWGSDVRASKLKLVIHLLLILIIWVSVQGKTLCNI